MHHKLYLEDSEGNRVAVDTITSEHHYLTDDSATNQYTALTLQRKVLEAVTRLNSYMPNDGK